MYIHCFSLWEMQLVTESFFKIFFNFFFFLRVIKVEVDLYSSHIISTVEINCLTYFMEFRSQ